MNLERIGLVSLHTSPLAAPGSGDAGGMNVYVVALGEAMHRAGYDVELLTRATSADQPPLDHTAGGVPVRFLVAGPLRAVPKRDLPAMVGRFQGALAEVPRFDVLHSHYWLSGLAALPVAAMGGIPHIQSLHTVAALKNARLAPGDPAEPTNRLNSERMLVTRSRGTIVSTAAERDSILADYQARPERVHVVAPGVDTTLFHPAPVPPASGMTGRATRTESGMTGSTRTAPHRPFILTLGRIQRLKGQDLAIRTLAAIPPAVRPDLVIAGAATPGTEQYLDELKALATGLGIADRVRFAGTQSRQDAAQLLRDASLVLMTSHSETFGLVALEAAASGTPVVAGRTSGLVSSVSDGVSGVLVDDREPASWAWVVSRLLGDPVRFAQLSASATAYGVRHSWNQTAHETLLLYLKAAVR
ncbi:glycosyltransferase [Subtercola boreus]|uniref:D-inositol 3-phosphate glycosyltransferase n=1 Tax=Subtercola boreus TaxID=120213 RepID=A0A3E0WDY2_9MICO|nr:glycosyltransferase [Subtercola boreus]RFA23428.1 hypothetical protein B7R24_00575 [Subtercola boreus]RFA23821.1 hypothetical protein B7R23_00575 [Subtercola boreus]RFA29522.1 hypothetical protein B7R25_00570 [Subtercola boreus]